MDRSIDVHSRARKKNLQMNRDDESPATEEESKQNRHGGDVQKPASDVMDTKVDAAVPANNDESSAGSSLFSSSNNEHADELGNANRNSDTKPAAKLESDDSSSELFSASDESVKVIKTTKSGIARSTPSNIAFGKMGVSPAVSGVTGCHDDDNDDSDDSLFSHDDYAPANVETCDTQQSNAVPAEPTTVQKNVSPKPTYLTFDRPAYKPEAESDNDSSDNGSLFSLNDREESSPSAPKLVTKMRKKLGATKAALHSSTFAIPRKKSFKPLISPAAADVVPLKQNEASRLCHKYSRQSSRDLPPDDPLYKVKKQKIDPKKLVSFATMVKEPKKFVGKSSRALKIAPRAEEDLGASRSTAQTTAAKIKDAEDGIYFDWQKSPKEKQWNKEFVKIKRFIGEHGNCDTPDGHSLSAWIRRQQKMGRSLLKDSIDWNKVIPDEMFSKFVHAFLLDSIGFDWGDDRRNNQVEVTIQDWAKLLDETQQKAINSYRDAFLPSNVKKAKVRDVDVTSDEEHEFDGDFVGDERRKHVMPKKKKMRPEIEFHHDTNRNNKRNQCKRGELVTASNDFVDERPKKISWNPRAKRLFDNRIKFQLSRAIRDKATEVLKKQASVNKPCTTNKQRCGWFDLEFAAPNCSQSNGQSHSTPDPALAKSNGKSSAKKRSWSEAEKLWSEIKPTQPHKKTPHATHDVARPEADMSNAPKAIEPLIDAATTKSTPTAAKVSQHEKRSPAISKNSEIPMVPSQDFPGWYTRYVPRKSKGGDYYYYSPRMKFMFRSRREVKRFLEILRDKDDEADAMDQYNRRFVRKSPLKKKKEARKTSNAADKQLNRTKAIAPIALSEIGQGSRRECSASLSAIPSPSREKRLLREGDEVYAPWKKNKRQKSPVYYFGVVLSIKGGDCSRVCDVRLHDGDLLQDLDESHVISKDEYLNNSLKHVYSVGDKVYSAWWPAKYRKIPPSWYPGKVKGVRVLPRGGKYGPSVLYDIDFDDGDEHYNVEDHFVFLESDYLFSTKQLALEKSEWIGVRNVVDDTSVDPWAKVVGWYVAYIGGTELAFPLLTDALRAFDSHTVTRLGSKTRKNDLNLPDEWTFVASGVPVRCKKADQIAGSKVIAEVAQLNSHADNRLEPARTVKQPDHIMRWKTAEAEKNFTNNKVVESSDCNSDLEIDENKALIGTFINKKKPEFKKGERVYAMLSSDDKWYPGRIWDIKTVPMSDSGYGPKRKFDVIYDDGEKETEVGEIYVMKKVDYELCLEKGEKNWIGVKNVVDSSSEDEFARAIGWYEVNMEGCSDTCVFSSLHEALRYHDKSLVTKKGKHVLASELNFPAEYNVPLTA